jgi:hypothetical protein
MIITLIAQTVNDVFGEVVPPSPVTAIGNGGAGINVVLNNIVSLFYTVGAVGFVIMFLYAAIEWIISGGEKDKIGSARKRMTWAVIGLAALSLTFVASRVIGGILGVPLFEGAPTY